ACPGHESLADFFRLNVSGTSFNVMFSPATPAEAPSLSPSIEDRAVRATLACVARHGLAKTTFDDVAREAGCARATLYRYFGGKRQLVRITLVREAARLAASIRDAGAAEATVADAPAPSPTPPIDLTDAAATRALVRDLVLPGLIGPQSAT